MFHAFLKPAWNTLKTLKCVFDAFFMRFETVKCVFNSCVSCFYSVVKYLYCMQYSTYFNQDLLKIITFIFWLTDYPEGDNNSGRSISIRWWSIWPSLSAYLGVILLFESFCVIWSNCPQVCMHHTSDLSLLELTLMQGRNNERIKLIADDVFMVFDHMIQKMTAYGWIMCFIFSMRLFRIHDCKNCRNWPILEG